MTKEIIMEFDHHLSAVSQGINISGLAIVDFCFETFTI